MGTVVAPDFKGVKVAPQPSNLVVSEFFIHVVGRCTCGSQKPLVLVLYPQMESGTQCDDCQTQFVLTGLAYDKVRPAEAILQVSATLPTILVP